MQELLANEAVLSTIIAVLSIAAIYLLEKFTKKDINPEGEAQIKGIVSRIVIALVALLKKKK